MDTVDHLTQYVRQTTGQDTRPKPLPRANLAGLPVFLPTLFDLYEIALFGKPVVIAIIKGGSRQTLSQLAKQFELLTSKFGRHVVLVLPSLASYERKRLLDKNIPFIVPGRQMFLPSLLVDLRESFPKRTAPPTDSLSWVAQVLVLRHLLSNDVTKRPLASVAHDLGYTPMAITQALDELERINLGRRVRAQRTKTIQFIDEAPKLWKKVLPYLRSPIKRSLHVLRFDAKDIPLLHAGITALAEITDIVPPRIRTVALSSKVVRESIKNGRLIQCETEDDAGLLIQSWAYAPDLLSTNTTVDPLSLYLTLKNDSDERIQSAVVQLMECIEW